MNRRSFLKTAAISSVLMSVSNFADSRPNPNKMNVLFLFSDDQRFDTIGFLGNKHIHTPNLDRLAKRSFVFENAYCFGGNTGAVCIPARNMAMSGNVFFRFRKEDGNVYANPNGPTFPKSMKAAGYETYYREKSGSANLPKIRLQFEHRKDIHQVKALRTGRPCQGIVNDAIEFLASERDSSRPFFMYLGLPCPHDPRWALKKFRDMYDQEKMPLPPNYKPVHEYDIGDMTVRDECLEKWPRTEDAVRRHLYDYYSVITAMDFDLGRLLDVMEKKGLMENTIIVFSSDQGLALGSHGLMGKQNVYEDTMKVPLFIAGPGIKTGKSEAMAYIHDIYPTVCDLVSAETPRGIDGRSLKPIIDCKKQAVRDSLMLAYRQTQRSVCDKRWKLIRFPKTNKTKFFDLKDDPHETNDLSEDPSYADQIDKMMKLLSVNQKGYGDKLPLTSAVPKPAAFEHPKKKMSTPYPAGGLAPGDPEYKQN